MGFEIPLQRNQKRMYVRLYEKPSLKYRARLSTFLMNELGNPKAVDVMVDFDTGEIAVSRGDSYDIGIENCMVSFPFDGMPRGLYRYKEKKRADLNLEGLRDWVILTYIPEEEE